MIAALVSAVSGGANLIIDKIILTRERVTLNVFIPILFVFLFAVTFVLVPSFGQVDWQSAQLPSSLFLFLLMILIAIAWNVLYYQSIQHEKVHQHELLVMTNSLVVILLAAIFFPEEFNWRIFGLAVIASLALVVSKIERAHLKFDQTSYNLMLAVVLMSTESIIIRELLFSYTPVALYAGRTFFLAVFFFLYYRPHYRRVSLKHRWLIALSALIGMIQMVTRFFAFDQLGIIYTALVSVLAPIIVFYASWEILHERIKARVIAASLVIMICVAVASVIKFS